LFPNTGRYYFIPVLPQGQTPALKCIPVSELQDVVRAKDIFNAAYPKWYDGDALVCRIGDTLTIQNSHENEDVTESYSVPLTSGWLTKLTGQIAPHSYLVAKLEDQGKRLWVQTNTEYPDRDTVLSIICARKPDWQIEPVSVAKEARWDEAAKTLSLYLSHQKGAVEVWIK
jgi:hypothetical protein